MILVDTSIWIDHFRAHDAHLVELASRRLICCHPGIIGELACGNFSDRKGKLTLLQALHQAPVASDSEVLQFIEQHKLMGQGVGYIDMQILTSTAIQPGLLWTRDRRLKRLAESLDLSY